MRDSVLEEGLRKGVRDMRDEMNVLLWKIERSRDISQEGMKVIVRKGFEAMAGAMEKVMNGVGERMVEEKGRRDRADRALEERMQWLEERNISEGKARGREDRGREERMRILEQRLEDQEKERQVRETAIYEALANLKERTGRGEDRTGDEWKDMAERIQALELLVKGKEGDGKEKEEQVSERVRKIEERDKAGEAERKEKDRIVDEKMRSLEEGLEQERKDREKMEKVRMEKERQIEKGLEKERNERMKWEEEKREEREKRERIESIKEMELKLNDSMENLKILNLKFEKVSQEKAELLKEAEENIKGKVSDRDRKECECILRRSRVYILGKGTEEKVLGKEKVYTAPLLVKCGSQVEKGRLEGMLRRGGVRVAFHWPKEMLEFVDEVRGRVEGMGYRKEEYFIKVRPYKVDGVLQLRAEVRRKDGKGEGFTRVGSWSCPPLARNLW
jgi:hypothetical protein